MSYPLSKHYFPDISDWNRYRKIRRLINEGFLIEASGAGLEVPVFHLTKKGFEFIQYELGYLTQRRFLPQSVPHDYWAMCFQQGEFAFLDSPDVEFFTEQELQSTDPSLLPDWIPRNAEHIPDGMTKLKGKEADFVVGIEVDLHLKPMLRYDKAAYHFDGLDEKTNIVFWLCDGMNLLCRIHERLRTMRHLRRLEIHHMILLQDFKRLGWNTRSRSGKYRDVSIRDIYAQNAHQMLGQSLINGQSKDTHRLFLDSSKTPYKPGVWESTLSAPLT